MVAEIKSVYYEVLKRVNKAPLPSVDTGRVILAEWVSFLRFTLYTPLSAWAGEYGLAKITDKAFKDNVVNEPILIGNQPISVKQNLPDPVTGLKNGDDGIFAVFCGDKAPYSIDSLEDILPTYQALANASEWGIPKASIVGINDLNCGCMLARHTLTSFEASTDDF